MINHQKEKEKENLDQDREMSFLWLFWIYYILLGMFYLACRDFL